MTKKKLPGDLKKRGRKRTDIDFEKAEKMAQILCTQSEISAVLGVPLSDLEHNPEFQRIHKRGLESGRASLRRSQYLAATGGNPTMLIWLGKQYLGQRDKNDIEMSGKDGAPIKTETKIDLTKEVQKLVGMLPTIQR
jgi:hypothetical protein